MSRAVSEKNVFFGVFNPYVITPRKEGASHPVGPEYVSWLITENMGSGHPFMLILPIGHMKTYCLLYINPIFFDYQDPYGNAAL